MATKYGKCTNIGNCDNADHKNILEILDGQNFICPECECELFSTQSPSSKKSNKTTYLLVFLFVVVGSLLFAFKDQFWSLQNSITDKSNVTKNEIDRNNEPPGKKDTNDESSAIKQRGFVRIGVQADSPPLNYFEKGKSKGLDYELAKLIFSQSEFGFNEPHSVSVDNQVENYEEIPGLLSKRDEKNSYIIDVIMGGLTFSDEDNSSVIYTIPYLEHFGYSLVSKGSDKINSLKDLRYKKIGIVKGDPDVAAYIEGNLPNGAIIVPLSDESETWITDSINHKLCDAIIYDFPFAAVEIEGTRLQIKVAKLPNSDIGYKIGLRKGNEHLRDELNSAIRKIKELPQYSNLLKYYLPVGNVVVPKNDGKNPTHIVLKGETLGLIAQNHLSSSERWAEIQALNNIPNPHLININQVLIMPTDYR